MSQISQATITTPATDPRHIVRLGQVDPASSTSITLPRSPGASVAFTVPVNLAAGLCGVGVKLRAFSESTPAKWLEGTVASYSATTLTLTVTASNGSGAVTDWKLAPSTLSAELADASDAADAAQAAADAAQAAADAAQATADAAQATADAALPASAQAADVNVAGTAIAAALGGKLAASALDTDGTMAANSDAKVASQKATRTYIASVLAGVAKNKGPLDCSANPNYPVALNGDFYRCSVAGKVGGASGVVVEVADLIMCVADNAGGTQAGVGTSWIVGQANIAGITAAGLAMLQAADATAQAALLAAVTETLTNKRITPRIGSTTSSATPTINTDNVDRYDLTAQSADITSFTSNLSGTPTNGQALWISVTGTAARAITWGASFESGAATLPTTTVTTDRLDVLFVWNAVTSKWRCTLTTVAAGLSDAPSNGHPYARKDGSWVRLEDSVLYLATFATNVTSIAGWSVTGDTPVLVGTDVKFANPGSITSITATDDFDTGATLDFSLLTGLTSIGGAAFFGGYPSSLTGALVLPDSITSIGSYAFGYCANLTSLTLGAGLISIGDTAFMGCGGFTGTLTIPSSVTSIGSSAFQNCSGFTGPLTIPSSVTSIGDSAFYGCSGFSGTLTIPSSVTSIAGYAFRGCSGLTTVNAYVERSVIDVSDSLISSGVTDIHARSSDGTWTAGAGQTIGGRTGITVTKDL